MDVFWNVYAIGLFNLHKGFIPVEVILNLDGGLQVVREKLRSSE